MEDGAGGGGSRMGRSLKDTEMSLCVSRQDTPTNIMNSHQHQQLKVPARQPWLPPNTHTLVHWTHWSVGDPVVSWRLSGQLEPQWSDGDPVVSWSPSGQLETQWSVGDPVVSWRPSGQMETQWSAGDPVVS